MSLEPHAADSTVLVAGTTTAVVTIAVVFLLIVAVGLVLLVRRQRATGSQGAGAGSGPGARAGSASGAAGKAASELQRANILLVHLDDALTRNDDELGFAIAQFGEQKTREFAAAVAAAKANLTEAFRLKQQLDDAAPDSETRRREWTARIIHLCESAQQALEAQSAVFAGLRRTETNAPQALAAVRELIATTEQDLAATAAMLTTLNASYSTSVLATVQNNVEEARALLDAASTAADTAAARLAANATDVAETVQDAAVTAQHAQQLLTEVNNLDQSLAAATTRLQTLEALTRANLVEARAARDSAPDPDSGAAIGDAIAAVDATLGGIDRGDPATSVSRIEASTATLDTALASARNQAQRLEHARIALTGALVTAKSQIATTGDFIASRRGGVGADARTRLAEAQRLLTIAEAEADPVTALDTARSSATYSRDADALARYDALR